MNKVRTLVAGAGYALAAVLVVNSVGWWGLVALFAWDAWVLGRAYVQYRKASRTHAAAKHARAKALWVTELMRFWAAKPVHKELPRWNG